jgi:hypothetical protein
MFIYRQPCPWDITLNRLRETEIELVEKPRLDHSFVSIQLQYSHSQKIPYLDPKKIFYFNLL